MAPDSHGRRRRTASPRSRFRHARRHRARAHTPPTRHTFPCKLRKCTHRTSAQRPSPWSPPASTTARSAAAWESRAGPSETGAARATFRDARPRCDVPALLARCQADAVHGRGLCRAARPLPGRWMHLRRVLGRSDCESSLDTKYPGIIEDRPASYSTRCFPGNPVDTVPYHDGNCLYLSVYSSHLRCVFPQHGPGRKHKRRSCLSPGSEAIVEPRLGPSFAGASGRMDARSSTAPTSTGLGRTST